VVKGESSVQVWVRGKGKKAVRKKRHFNQKTGNKANTRLPETTPKENGARRSTIPLKGEKTPNGPLLFAITRANRLALASPDEGTR